jgi:hypothetical protein
VSGDDDSVDIVVYGGGLAGNPNATFAAKFGHLGGGARRRGGKPHNVAFTVDGVDQAFAPRPEADNSEIEQEYFLSRRAAAERKADRIGAIIRNYAGVLHRAALGLCIFQRFINVGFVFFLEFERDQHPFLEFLLREVELQTVPGLDSASTRAG